MRTATVSIETETEGRDILKLLSDPTLIPDWAKAFADSVDYVSGSWTAKKDGRTFSLRLVVNGESGTVDYLREVAPGIEGGAFIRVMPRPRGGTVIVITIPVGSGDTASSVKVLETELAALCDLARRSAGS